MPIPFAEVRFPESISYGSSGGPSFNTTVQTALSGKEQRNSNWERSRAVYDVSHGIRDKVDMDAILDFFYTMRGRATGFRFKDWSDFELVDGLIGTGDGVETSFQIVKKYGTGIQEYTRPLYKIVQPIAGPPPIEFVVKVNDVVVPSGFTVNYNTGVITFDSPVTDTHTVKVSCEFDVPVRFDVDEMNITLESFELESWDSIQLIELRNLT